MRSSNAPLNLAEDVLITILEKQYTQETFDKVSDILHSQAGAVL